MILKHLNCSMTLKNKNEQLFPVAWAMYKNSANLDDENQKN